MTEKAQSNYDLIIDLQSENHPKTEFNANGDPIPTVYRMRYNYELYQKYSESLSKHGIYAGNPVTVIVPAERFSSVRYYFDLKTWRSWGYPDKMTWEQLTEFGTLEKRLALAGGLTSKPSQVKPTNTPVPPHLIPAPTWGNKNVILVDSDKKVHFLYEGTVVKQYTFTRANVGCPVSNFINYYAEEFEIEFLGNKSVAYSPPIIPLSLTPQEIASAFQQRIHDLREGWLKLRERCLNDIHGIIILQ